MTENADVDLTAAEQPGDPRVRLKCTRCPGRTRPVRKADDPDTVVRCGTCGKKHSTDSLTTAPGGA